MADDTKGTCFVVMGFGKKTDFETGRTLDLDMSYQNLIKPAVEAAGLTCLRADEIVHSGMIDVPMYEQLLNADVVVADLSTSNKNAYYELGVRHALRPHTTLVIAEDGIKAFPFDVNHVAVRQYHHLGEDIGVKEARRFTAELARAIGEILKQQPRAKDSPVYTLLNRLSPPVIAKALQAALAPETAKAGADDSRPAEPKSVHCLLMQQVDEAQKQGNFLQAKVLLSSVREMMKPAGEKPEDPYILQRLALLTYKSRYPSEEAALKEARDILTGLGPFTSNDTETLGLWGAVHKRLWHSTGDPSYLDEAVRGYERGFYLRNDYYNGINLAFLLNVRSASNAKRPAVSVPPDSLQAEPGQAEAIADFVQARRIRREVIAICRAFLEGEGMPPATRYWATATLAEAHIGVGDDERGGALLNQALAMPVDDWMKTSTREQLAKLKALLADSPLRRIRPG